MPERVSPVDPVERGNLNHIAYRVSDHVVVLEPNVDFDDPARRGWLYEDYAWAGSGRYALMSEGSIDADVPSADDVRAAVAAGAPGLSPSAFSEVDEVDWYIALAAVYGAEPVFAPADLPTVAEARAKDREREVPPARREYRYEGKNRPTFLSGDGVTYIHSEDAGQDSDWWESHRFVDDDGNDYWDIDEIREAGPSVTGAWTRDDFLELCEGEADIAASVFEELDPSTDLASDPAEIYDGLMGEEIDSGISDLLDVALSDIEDIAREDSMEFDPATLAPAGAGFPSRRNVDRWYRATARVKAVRRIVHLRREQAEDELLSRIEALEEDMNYSQDLNDSFSMAEAQRDLAELLQAASARRTRDPWDGVAERLNRASSRRGPADVVGVELVDAAIRWKDTGEPEVVTFSDRSTEGLDLDEEVFMSGYTREDLEAARRGEVDLGEDFEVMSVLDGYRAYGKPLPPRQEPERGRADDAGAAERTVLFSAAAYAAGQGLERAWRDLDEESRPATFEEFASSLAAADLALEVDDADKRFGSVLAGGLVVRMGADGGMGLPTETFGESLRSVAEGDLGKVALIEDEAGELAVTLAGGERASFRKTSPADAAAARAAHESAAALAGEVWARSAKPAIARYGDVMNAAGWIAEPEAAWEWGLGREGRADAPWARLSSEGAAFAADVSERAEAIEFWEVTVTLTDEDGNRKVVLAEDALTLAEAIAAAERAAVENGFTPDACDRDALDEAFLPVRSLGEFARRCEEECGLTLNLDAIEADLWASSQGRDDFESVKGATADVAVDRLGTLVPYATHEKWVLGYNTAKLACRPVSKGNALSRTLSKDVLASLPASLEGSLAEGIDVFRATDPHVLYDHMSSLPGEGTAFVYGDLAYVLCPEPDADAFERRRDDEWLAFKLDRTPETGGSWQRVCCMSLPEDEGAFLRDLGQMQLSTLSNGGSIGEWRVVDAALGDALRIEHAELSAEARSTLEAMVAAPAVRAHMIEPALAKAAGEFVDRQEKGLPYDPSGLVVAFEDAADSFRSRQGAASDPEVSREVAGALYGLYMEPLGSRGREEVLRAQSSRGSVAAWKPEPPASCDLSSMRRWTCAQSAHGRLVEVSLEASDGLATATAREGDQFGGPVRTVVLADGKRLGEAVLAAEGALACARRGIPLPSREVPSKPSAAKVRSAAREAARAALAPAKPAIARR